MFAAQPESNRAPVLLDSLDLLEDLKHTYRPDIHDKAALEQNFRERFEALNRVRPTDAESARLRDEIINADILQAAKTQRHGWNLRSPGC